MPLRDQEVQKKIELSPNNVKVRWPFIVIYLRPSHVVYYPGCWHCTILTSCCYIGCFEQQRTNLPFTGRNTETWWKIICDILFVHIWTGRSIHTHPLLNFSCLLHLLTRHSQPAALAAGKLVWWVFLTTRPRCYITHTSSSSLGRVCTCLDACVCVAERVGMCTSASSWEWM